MKLRKNLSLLLVISLLLVLLTGCGASSTAKNDYAMEAPEAAAPMEEHYSLTMDSAAGSNLTAPENRKWIITVEMTAETEDLDAMLATLGEKVQALKGYLEDQSIYNGSNYSDRRYRNANLTVRIPASDVDAFTEAVSGISNVVRQNRNLEDITLNYVSTESRVAALETEEKRLLDLMAQAETMSDLLEIESRLTDVRYELESNASRLRLYDNQIDYATIHLYIEEVQEYTPVQERTVWQRISEGFTSSLKGVGEGLVDLLVWILAKSPYLVVYGAVIAGIVLLLKKRPLPKLRRKKKTAAQPEQKEDK